MSLNGTRDTAAYVQMDVAKLMKSLGYSHSVYNASLYHPSKHGVRVLVHGDDFAALGGREDCKLQATAGQEVHSYKQDRRIRKRRGEIRETRVLSRVCALDYHGLAVRSRPKTDRVDF